MHYHENPQSGWLDNQDLHNIKVVGCFSGDGTALTKVEVVTHFHKQDCDFFVYCDGDVCTWFILQRSTLTPLSAIAGKMCLAPASKNVETC